MKKIAVLTLIATLNLGGAAGELLFQDGFESGWPNAWAEAVGWSPFFVKDSTGALVGPVVGFWTDRYQETDPAGVPLVAVRVNGRKGIFKAGEASLAVGRAVYFDETGCMGQAYLSVENGSPGHQGHLLADVQDFAFGIGPGNVLYVAEPPALPNPGGPTYSSLSQEDFEGGTQNCTNVTPTLVPGRVWLASTEVDLDTLFIPPYSLE